MTFHPYCYEGSLNASGSKARPQLVKNSDTLLRRQRLRPANAIAIFEPHEAEKRASEVLRLRHQMIGIVSQDVFNRNGLSNRFSVKALAA
jgi:hypothetical protein